MAGVLLYSGCRGTLALPPLLFLALLASLLAITGTDLTAGGLVLAGDFTLAGGIL